MQRKLLSVQRKLLSVHVLTECSIGTVQPQTLHNV